MLTSIYWINGHFRVSTGSNEITIEDVQKAKSVTKLEPRVMEVLRLLIEANGSIVSREYLIEKVWLNYEGSDEGLNQAISKLRKIFQDDAKRAKIIETISKKGYRIIARIEEEYDRGFVSVKSNMSEKNIPALISLLDYLNTPKRLLIFVIVSAVLLTLLYLFYKIIYAVVWS